MTGKPTFRRPRGVVAQRSDRMGRRLFKTSLPFVVLQRKPVRIRIVSRNRRFHPICLDRLPPPVRGIAWTELAALRAL